MTTSSKPMATTVAALVATNDQLQAELDALELELLLIYVSVVALALVTIRLGYAQASA